MSAAKHTPGPWQAAGKHICQDDGGVVGYVTAYAMPTPRQQADARLMAAAPELLEALQALLAADRADMSAIVGRDVDGHPLNAAGVARKAARAAIAKATGSAA